MTTTIGRTTPKARKVHRCCWCKEPIRPGEVYERWVAKDVNDVWTLKAHPECVDAMQTIHRANHLNSDEETCYRTDHERGFGCEECDPALVVRP